MKPKSPVQKNNLVVFPSECTHVNPKIYIDTRGIFAFTSLQEYLFLLIQLKSIHPHVRTHTRL